MSSDVMRKTLKHLFNHRRFSMILVIVTFVVCLPSLWGGFQVDDLFQRLAFKTPDCITGFVIDTWEMFTFMSGDPELTSGLVNRGVVPWWTGRTIRAAFWRPVTVLSHQLDYALWPDQAWLMHLQSLLWYCGVVVLVLLFYRRILDITWVAGLAALLYALDDAHGWPVGWLANRNAVIATFFGLLCLLSHDAWRVTGKKAQGILAVLVYCIALLSGEAALATSGYLFAYALFIDRSRWLQRIVSLVPYALLTVLWQVAYQLQGYGTKGMGLYIDPGAETGLFVAALFHRVPLLLSAQLGGPPAFVDMFFTDPLNTIYWATAILFLIGIGFIMVRELRSDRVAGFFLVGMVVATIPISATFPHERLLMFTGIGGMGLIARFVQVAWKQWGASSHGSFRLLSMKFAAIFLIFAHGLVGPATLPLSVWSPKVFGMFMDRTFKDFEPFPGENRSNVVVLTTPLSFFTGYYSVVCCLTGQAVPDHMRRLAPASTDVVIERIDERTLEITPAAGFLSGPMDQLFRAPQEVFHVGDRISLPDVTIDIVSITPDGRPFTTRFSFTHVLEDPITSWYAYDRDTSHHTRWIPPAVGEKILLPIASYMPWKLFDEE